MIADTTRSPHTRLRPVPVNAVCLADVFWSPRRLVNRCVTLPSQYRQLEETGRVDNFRRAAGNKDIPFQGYFFNDSDVYKWLEAVSWALADGRDPALEGMAEAVINEVLAAQGGDGYLDTYFTFERAAERWTNLRDLHELYCAGHLIQAAIAYRRVTGDERLFTAACRLADHICATFGTGKRPAVPGHPEVEMALVELARETGEVKYLKQARHFIDHRGRGLIGGSEYHLDRQPLRELDRLGGHAVRALYLCAGATDICIETGEPNLRLALERLWKVLVTRQMYINGGVGSRYEGESIGGEFELPNARAYSETCAAIANVMWNWRMLQLSGEACYTDILELALYNGVLPGIAMDGTAYFYENPLQSDGSQYRQPWFPCACCPPNVARLIAQMPGYFYSLSDDGLWVHLYAQGEAHLNLSDGQQLVLTQTTQYPWNGEVEIEIRDIFPPSNGNKVETDQESSFSLHLRIPGWVEAPRIWLNGKPHDGATVPGTYVDIHRSWQRGDVIRLDLSMPVRLIESHPHLLENAGRVAVMRGPLLYCSESVDNPGIDLRDVALSMNSGFSVENDTVLLGGIAKIQTAAVVEPLDKAWRKQLYRPFLNNTRTPIPVQLTLIPYFAWANRAAGAMQVWMRI